MGFFDIPDSWKEHWTKYPGGFTIMEMLASWQTKANDLKADVDNFEVLKTDKTTTTALTARVLNNELTKTDLVGDHQGTWQGYSPSASEPGIQAVVDDHTEQLAQIAHQVPLPDGVNDKQIINDALVYAGQNGLNVLFPPKEIYNVNPSVNNENIIVIPYDNLSIDLNGSLIKVGTNGFTGYNLTYVLSKKNIVIKNGVLAGDRLTHDYLTITNTHEFGYGIYSVHSSVIVENMEIYDMIGDAVITRDDYDNVVKYKDCNFHHCRRQGLSVLNSHEVYMDNCHIHHIGTFDGITGTSPFSGIDLEPDMGTFAINYFELTNSKIEDCTGFGLISGDPVKLLKAKIDNLETNCTVSMQATESKITNSDFNNTNIHYSNFAFYIDSDVENSTFKFTSLDKVVYFKRSIKACRIEGSSSILGSSTQIAGSFTMQECDLINLMGTSTKGRGGLDSATNLGVFTIKNNRFNTCSLMFNTTKSIPKNEFLNCDVYISTGLKVTFKHCDFVDCSTSNNYQSIVELDNCYLQGNSVFFRAAKIARNSTIKINALLAAEIFNYGANNVKSLFIGSTLKITDELTNMDYLPSSHNCTFELNPLNSASVLPVKCINSNIVTNLEVSDMAT